MSDGCSHPLTAPSQEWLFPFFGFLPQTSTGFSREEVLGCPVAEGEGAALWAVCHLPALSVLPWKNQRVFYGMWPRDAFSFRMGLNLSSLAAKPSAARVGHSLKTKALKKLFFSQKIALVAGTVTELHSSWLNDGFVPIS